MQKALAFDLRSFQELGIRFVILGVWREKNRLTQFNGDLQDRIIEVPVEPWSEKEFREVIAIGSEKLNIEVSETIQTNLIESAFDSIGVVQELAGGPPFAVFERWGSMLPTPRGVGSPLD